MKKHYKFEIDCANCAAKVEEAIKKIDGVHGASDEILQQVITTAKKIEPDCELHLK